MSVSRPQAIAEQEKEARAWRERFVQNAVANVCLEGLEPSPKALEIWQRYIEGEVSVEQAGELDSSPPDRRVVSSMSSDPYVYPGTTVLKNLRINSQRKESYAKARNYGGTDDTHLG